MSQKPFGIDELRMAVRWFGSHLESFNQSFTAEELLRLWRYARAHAEVDELADQWTAAQVEAALEAES